MDQHTSAAHRTRVTTPDASRKTSAAPASSWLVWKTFFSEFLRHPTMVGSIIPTSRQVVNAMLAPVAWDECTLFVEYGPGLGTFTHDILARLGPDAKLIAIDTNARFIDHLRENIPDPRFHAVNGSAADVQDIIAAHEHGPADFILSGLPFSTLPKGVGPAIMAATHAALRPGGAFLVYQYSRFVLPMLRVHFEHIEEDMVWRNVPPCRNFFAWKDRPSQDGPDQG
jgi:phospholipid N-methyltransferase